MRSPRGILWLQGDAGSGKTELLRANIPRWPFSSVWMDLRRATEVMASAEPAVPADGNGNIPRTVLILDDMPPADLLCLMQDPLHPASELLLSHPGPVLLVSRTQGQMDLQALTARTGRSVDVMAVPPSGIEQRLGILRSEQSCIEREWQVEIAPCALQRAARGLSPDWPETPGGSVRWLTAAAARVTLEAEQGDPALRAVEARIDDLNRALLLAQARNGDVEALERDLHLAEIERAAYAVDWHERERRGELRKVQAGDIDREIRAARCSAWSDSVPEVLGRKPYPCSEAIAEDG
ncbi:hypothetical protein [Marinobacter halodurans]|nr:hypothetical protein [Marinobacter halodurans]